MASSRRIGAAACCLLLFAATGCSGSAATNPSAPPAELTSQAAPTAGSTSATPSGSTPTDTVSIYALTAGTRVNVESTGTSWPAQAGSLRVTNLSGGNVQIFARSAGSKPSDTAWLLDLTISSSGRSVTGTLTSGSSSWRVLPHTGSVGITTQDLTAHSWTARALTIAPTLPKRSKVTGPMTFILNGSASTR